MEKTGQMLEFEQETGKQSAIVKFSVGGQALEMKNYPKLGPYDYNTEYLAWLEAKAAAYDRLIDKLSLWGKHLKSASMTQNSLDFIYCAQQVMDEITLTLPDGWEES